MSAPGTSHGTGLRTALAAIAATQISFAKAAGGGGSGGRAQRRRLLREQRRRREITKAMALDYAQHGIRVNAICCGEIDTPLFERESYRIGMTPDSYRELLNEYHPIGRIGLPSEAAATVAFLANDDASFITGALLPVDGGYAAQ